MACGHQLGELRIRVDVEDQVCSRLVAVHDRVHRLIVECPCLANREMLRSLLDHQEGPVVRDDRNVDTNGLFPGLVTIVMHPSDAVWLGTENEGVYNAAEGTLWRQQGGDVGKFVNDWGISHVVGEEILVRAFAAASKEQHVDRTVHVPVTVAPGCLGDLAEFLHQPRSTNCNRELQERSLRAGRGQILEAVPLVGRCV